MREITIRLTDADYTAAQKRAQGRGVEAYVVEMLKADILAEDPDNFDHIFTPEYIAHLDASIAEAKVGDFLTPEQADQSLEETRRAWRAEQSA
jgi:hypothetical protein